MGDEQRVSWQRFLAQSRDDFEAGTRLQLSTLFPDTRVVLGFVCLWALADAVGYAEQCSRKHDVAFSEKAGSTPRRIKNFWRFADPLADCCGSLNALD
jgi:hypothetical protein